MGLTDAQKTTLKADILANTDPAVVAALAAGDVGVIANWYNQPASPDYWIYKGVVPIDEVSAAIQLDDVANMTTGDNEKLKTFYTIRSVSGVFASKASDRVGFDDIFSAAAGDDSQQALIALWKRLASNVEKVFATGAGTNATPSDAGYFGPIAYQEIAQALNS